MNKRGIVSYATYLPHFRLSRQALGVSARAGERVVAASDEDSTTMAVEAARRALDHLAPGAGEPESIYLATTSPAYLDKTNAAAVHAALALPPNGFAADLAGSARSGIAALKMAAATGGLALLSDVRVGRPGSPDERGGGDGAAAFLFGEPDVSIAEFVTEVSLTVEFLDRWRDAGQVAAEQWEERFGQQIYLPLIRQAATLVLAQAGLDRADHVILTSPNYGVAKQSGKLVTGLRSTSGSPIGHCGAADAGLALASVLDSAGPGETILLLSAADGCDAILLRTTEQLPLRRQSTPLAIQLRPGIEIPYLTYLTWRGLIVREAPRRPEPDRPAGPPSARGEAWKFGFVGSQCTVCGFVHLPPLRVCKKCGSVDRMSPSSTTGTEGTVATSTVDRLAYSLSPPLVLAVVDFDGGGRFTVEIADTDAGSDPNPDGPPVGTRVALTFRRLFTAGGVHNYFWKARVLPVAQSPAPEDIVEAGESAPAQVV